ncbi:MAG TPA: rhomboid family intramembrane serine protease [Micromonosporaceae bacterium]
MTEPQGDERERFGTPAFYAGLGKAFVIMCAVIPVLFAIELIDKASGHALDRDGAIVPHHISGLDGIVFAPFLHVSFVHLYGNAVPLLLTGTFVLAAGGKRFLWITALIALVSGLGVWFFGAGPTIGASGVIFGYLGYLFLRGLIERNWWNIAVALLVGLLFGTAITGVVPGNAGVSWQAHLFGFIGGLLAAVLFRRPRPKRKPATETPTDFPSTLTFPSAS